MVNVDRTAIVAGARVAVAVATITVLVALAVSSFTTANANLPLYFALLSGMGAAGWVAARRQPRSPLTHGALAAIAGFLVVVAAVVVIRLALGRGVADPASIVFHLLMAASAGILGGYLATRRSQAAPDS